ncbi:MAG: glycosyltransferase [Oscillospiraceae bacterium]|nr:glycosyltransferase [Oscillospiraceae bacterium]
MKVLLLNDSFPPVLDGVANVLLNYAHYLTQDYGAEVMVGTPYYPDADYSSYPYKVVTYQSFDTSSITNGYRAGNPFASKAIAEMAEFKPDIIHVHCPASAAVIARILRETTGAPLVFTYHTKYDIDIRRVVKNKLVADETIKAMVGVVESANEVWAVSEGAGRSLVELGFEGEWSVMPNGVDFERGRVEPDKVAEATRDYDLGGGIPVFLFVGRMMTYKNIPLILDALKMLSDSGRDYRAVFIGKGPDKELMEEKAKELGIADKTIFTGPIYDRDTLRAWNTRADLFLFPSTFDTNGLVVREAAACGLGSVLVRGSCAAEGVTDGENGFLIDESAESLFELLKKVSGDFELMHRVGENAMNELYMSWRDCVGIAYRRYEKILTEKELGTLPVKKKDASDLLVSMTAKTMEEQEKMRKFFTEVKDFSLGMMDNRAEEIFPNAEPFWRDTIRKE